MKLRGLILCSSVADLSLIICDFDTASDLSFRSFILSCEIVVGSWVGISQVKIKSSLSRSALLFFADGCGVIINTSSSDILFDNIVIRNPAIISFDT